PPRWYPVGPLVLEASTGPAPLTGTDEPAGTGRYRQDQRGGSGAGPARPSARGVRAATVRPAAAMTASSDGRPRRRRRRDQRGAVLPVSAGGARRSAPGGAAAGPGGAGHVHVQPGVGADDETVGRLLDRFGPGRRAGAVQGRGAVGCGEPQLGRLPPVTRHRPQWSLCGALVFPPVTRHRP